MWPRLLLVSGFPIFSEFVQPEVGRQQYYNTEFMVTEWERAWYGSSGVTIQVWASCDGQALIDS